jgi:hypothetical protein
MSDVLIPAAPMEAWLKGYLRKSDELTKINPAMAEPKVMEYMASEGLFLIKGLKHPDNRLTVEQFAKLPHVDVTPQTVRHWIRTGQLQAIDTPKGYKIAADAKRIRRSA